MQDKRILLIGGPEEPDTFRRYPNITHVQCDGFSLLAGLDDLDTYNVIIFWPTPDVLGIPSPNTAKITDIEMLLIGWEQKNKVRLLNSYIDDIIETAICSVTYTKDTHDKFFNINLDEDPGFKDRLAHLSIDQLLQINNRILSGANVLCIVPEDFYLCRAYSSQKAFAWMPLVDIRMIDEEKKVVIEPQTPAMFLAHKLTEYISTPWRFYFTCMQPTEETLDWYEEIADQVSTAEHMDSYEQFRLHTRSVFRLFIPKYYHRRFKFTPAHIDEDGLWKSVIFASPSRAGSMLFIPEVKSLDKLLDIVTSFEEMIVVPASAEPSIPKPAAADSPAISPATKLTLELGDNRIPLSVQEKEGSTQVVANEFLRGQKAQNIFRRRGGLWQIRFNGKNAFLQNHTNGLTYIRALLDKPNENIPAIELHQYVNPISSSPQSEYMLKDINTMIKKAAEDNVTPMIGIHTRESGNQEIYDNKSKVYVATKLKQLMVAHEKAKSHGNETLAAEIQNEINDAGKELEAAAVGNKKISSKFRSKNDERARDAIRKAIDAAIKSIKEHDSHLALHLSNHIKKGYSLVYKSDPKEKIVWTL